MSPLLPSNASAIAKLASSHPSLLNVQDQDGKTPLHLALDFAVRTYDTAPAEALLAAGADATLLDNAGNNALHILSPGLFPTQATRDLFAKLATTHGVAINAQNLLGLAPAVGAFSQPTSANYTSTANRDLFPRLEMDFEPFAPDKARAFIKDVCKFLTDLGADLQILDHEGRGLLHHVGGGASNYWFFYRKTYFQALMEIGFDPFAEDKRQRTAVDVAVANGDREVLALFGKDGGKAGK
ncbi:ankyrin [Sporormia fimetaria CBS 119925]|uniref:Ankyrin n=1 Tax=Sporormia fimetaria CBS 119925 TaxID=1340428 RepID=A0A6A6VA92_9PLEO|nr:ankyrin [Sporormia fimetaria CBS 119925]